MTRAAAGVVVAALAVGCAHGAEGPGPAAAAFGEALARGDLRGAYQLTSADFQHRTPFAAFAADLQNGGGEPAALGRRLAAEAALIPPRVEVQLALGERVSLVLEDNRWRVDGPIYEAWGQGTPRAAVRTFVRALDARRYDIVLRLIPDRERVGLTADRLRAFWEGEERQAHHALLEQIQAAAPAGALTEGGDEARLAVSPDREVRLVREADGWKIADPDER